MAAKKKKTAKPPAKKATKKSVASLAKATRVTHRAVCDRGDFNGPLRDLEEQAWNDAAAHQATHQGHRVDVVTIQTG